MPATSLNNNKIPGACSRNELPLFYVIAACLPLPLIRASLFNRKREMEYKLPLLQAILRLEFTFLIVKLSNFTEIPKNMYKKLLNLATEASATYTSIVTSIFVIHLNLTEFKK